MDATTDGHGALAAEAGAVKTFDTSGSEGSDAGDDAGEAAIGIEVTVGAGAVGDPGIDGGNRSASSCCNRQAPSQVRPEVLSRQFA